MTPEAWAVNVAAILAAITASGIGAWTKRGISRVEGKVETAAEAAEAAAAKVEPVSNGFARKVTGGLEEIRSLVQEVRDEQARLSDRVTKIEDRQIAHLEDHVRARQG